MLISYPKDMFHVPGILKASINTDVSLSTREIPDTYVERWPVEVIFRQSENKLAFDRYQNRSAKELHRYWLLISLAHLIACTGYGESMPFEDGYTYICSHIQEERLCSIYQYEERYIPFKEVLVLEA